MSGDLQVWAVLKIGNFQERLGPGALPLKKWCFELTASKSAHETEADISKHKAQVVTLVSTYHICGSHVYEAFSAIVFGSKWQDGP